MEGKLNRAVPARARNVELVFLTILVTVLGICCGHVPGYAQEMQAYQDSGEESGSPSQKSVENKSRFSFFDASSQILRRTFGFSFEAYEAFSSHSVDPSKDYASMNALAQRFYLNFGRRRSTLHLDYGAGYRTYNQKAFLNHAEHSGNLTFDYQISPAVNFQITDHVLSSTNDGLSFFSSEPSQRPLAVSRDWIYENQRVTQNSIAGRLGIRIGRSNDIWISSSYNLYRYGTASIPINNSDYINAAMEFSHKINRWVSITSNYSSFISGSDERFRDSRIHRIQASGLELNLNRNWNLKLSGGADILEGSGYSPKIKGSYFGMLSRDSRMNSLFVTCNSQYESALSVLRILKSDSIGTGWARKLGRKVNAQLSAHYIHSKDVLQTGKLESIGILAGVEYEIRRSVILKTNYGYQKQNNSIVGISDDVNLDRQLANIGLQFFWPSSRR